MARQIVTVLPCGVSAAGSLEFPFESSPYGHGFLNHTPLLVGWSRLAKINPIASLIIASFISDDVVQASNIHHMTRRVEHKNLSTQRNTL